MRATSFLAPALLAGLMSLGTARGAFADPHPLWLHGHGPVRSGSGSELYYGGPVISTVKVYSVLWGTGVNKQVASAIGGFFAAATNSTWFDIMTQYGTHRTGVNGHAGTNQQIGRGTYAGQIAIAPANKKSSLTDKMVQRELLNQIGTGKLPAPDANTLYMVYFPPSITISLGQAQSCVAFGAYHEGFKTSSGTPVLYGVMPDCGFSFATETSVSAHELAEATTDAFPTPGSHPNFPQAWNTSSGEEIGDLCEGSNGTLTAPNATYTVQQIYSDSIARCTSGNYHSP